MNRTLTFTREQLRAPFNIALLTGVPTMFVAAAAGVLSDFSRALGGTLVSDGAVVLSAGWAAAFLAGAIGFFTAASSRRADRRLVIAGIRPVAVAMSRIVAALLLAVLAALAAFITLAVRTSLAHPWHVAAGIVAFAWLYLGVGVVIGSFVTDPLAGSLTVTLVFILDVFSGPGMGTSIPLWALSRHAAEILIAAGAGRPSSSQTWTAAIATTGVALLAAWSAFSFTTRRRR